MNIVLTVKLFEDFSIPLPTIFFLPPISKLWTALLRVVD